MYILSNENCENIIMNPYQKYICDVKVGKQELNELMKCLKLDYVNNYEKSIIYSYMCVMCENYFCYEHNYTRIEFIRKARMYMKDYLYYDIGERVGGDKSKLYVFIGKIN